MSDNEASITRLLDEAAVRDVTARFADTAIRADYDGFRRLWADDAEWVIGGTEGQPFERRANGIDDVVSLFRKLRDEREYFVQFAVQGPIEINGDEATATCVCHEAARGPGESYYRNNGIWSDRLRRSDQGWVFTSCIYQYLWLVAAKEIPYLPDATRFQNLSIYLPKTPETSKLIGTAGTAPSQGLAPRRGSPGTSCTSTAAPGATRGSPPASIEPAAAHAFSGGVVSGEGRPPVTAVASLDYTVSQFNYPAPPFMAEAPVALRRHPGQPLGSGPRGRHTPST